MGQKIAPLSGTFLIASMILFFIAFLKIYPWNKTWGFTMILFSVVMFVSSILSMEYADAKAVLSLDHIKFGGEEKEEVKKPVKKKVKKKKAKKRKK